MFRLDQGNVRGLSPRNNEDLLEVCLADPSRKHDHVKFIRSHKFFTDVFSKVTDACDGYDFASVWHLESYTGDSGRSCDVFLETEMMHYSF